VAIELRAMVRFSLPDAVSGGPSSVTNGLAAVCSNTTPSDRTYYGSKKEGIRFCSQGRERTGNPAREIKPAPQQWSFYNLSF
jgi:hypothetical protein